MAEVVVCDLAPRVVLLIPDTNSRSPCERDRHFKVKVSELSEFLAKTYPRNIVWNAERAVQSVLESEKLGNQIVRLSLPKSIDTPPRLETLLTLGSNMVYWLNLDRKDHIAVINCSDIQLKLSTTSSLKITRVFG